MRFETTILSAFTKSPVILKLPLRVQAEDSSIFPHFLDISRSTERSACACRYTKVNEKPIDYPLQQHTRGSLPTAHQLAHFPTFSHLSMVGRTVSHLEYTNTRFTLCSPLTSCRQPSNRTKQRSKGNNPLFGRTLNIPDEIMRKSKIDNSNGKKVVESAGEDYDL